LSAVVLDTLPGVRVAWDQTNPPGAGAVGGYYVTARPLTFFNTSVALGTNFLQDVMGGQCGANIVSSVARPGWLRLSTNGNNCWGGCYGTGNKRNAAPGMCSITNMIRVYKQ
jgi:hypothetical protein